jgi:hypothetical protein
MPRVIRGVTQAARAAESGDRRYVTYALRDLRQYGRSAHRVSPYGGYDDVAEQRNA